jgi:serpin B
MILIPLMIVVGCGAFSGRHDGEQSRGLVVPAPATDLSALEAGNLQFALDLYGKVRAQPGNQFLSPYSISLALAMTSAGARGATLAQMASTLHFALPAPRVHAAAGALMTTLASRAAAEATPGAVELDIANGLWAQAGLQIQPAFTNTLAEDYGANAAAMDFRTQPEASRLAINQWVSDHTAHLIPQLLPPGFVRPDTRLLLANAIHFKAAWLAPFAPLATLPGPFTREDGSQVMVPMMSQRHAFRTAVGDGWQAVELAYVGGEVTLLVVMPDAGTMGAFEVGLDAVRWGAITRALVAETIALRMPKLHMTTKMMLKGTLEALGMTDAFGLADFSGIDGARDLAISDVVHQAVLDVNERTTEAAAATGVGLRANAVALPRPVRQVVIDHPFVLAIRDVLTGTVLFLGRVIDPR